MGAGGSWEGRYDGGGGMVGGERGAYGGGMNYRDETGREHALRAQQERLAQVCMRVISLQPNNELHIMRDAQD